MIETLKFRGKRRRFLFQRLSNVLHGLGSQTTFKRVSVLMFWIFLEHNMRRKCK